MRARGRAAGGGAARPVCAASSSLLSLSSSPSLSSSSSSSPSSLSCSDVTAPDASLSAALQKDDAVMPRSPSAAKRPHRSSARNSGVPITKGSASSGYENSETGPSAASSASAGKAAVARTPTCTRPAHSLTRVASVGSAASAGGASSALALGASAGASPSS